MIKRPAILIAVILVWGSLAGQAIQPLTGAGTFYHGSERALNQELTRLLKAADTDLPREMIVGLWAPHAGLTFSGTVAARVYQAVARSKQGYDAVVILASSHRYPFRGVSAAPFEAYHTPAGDVRVVASLRHRLKTLYPALKSISEAHAGEHAEAMQMIFVQHVLPDVPVLPLVLGNVSSREAADLAEALKTLRQDHRLLLVASSDLSHYPAYESALKSDRQVMRAVESRDYRRLEKLDAQPEALGVPGLVCALCGWRPLEVVMRCTEEDPGARIALWGQANSADVSNDRSRTVGYGAALFLKSAQEENMSDSTLELSGDEKAQLFYIARTAMTAAIQKENMPDFDIPDGLLKKKAAVFVTLLNSGMLRGCIGTFEPAYPLWEAVQEMAVAAATRDYRFAYNPVSVDEMGHLTIKISILSERRLISDINEIEVGKHGVWVEHNGRGGTYLPEVAVEQGWDRIELLEHLCGEKAGLSKDAYKQGAKVYVYTSQVISE